MWSRERWATPGSWPLSLHLPSRQGILKMLIGADNQKNEESQKMSKLLSLSLHTKLKLETQFDQGLGNWFLGGMVSRAYYFT